MSDNLTWKEKLGALVQVAKFKPFYTAFLVVLSGFVALLEGIGLGFILPIVEVAQSGEDVGDELFLQVFVSFYEFLGIPFSLGFLVLGVSLVMVFRYSMSFLTSWLKLILSKDFERHLRKRAFKSALEGKISYFDREGSDRILNAIITETGYSRKVITRGVNTMEMIFMIVIYLSVMFYISPFLTILAALLLGGITVILRYIVEPAVVVGARVAQANENVQEAVQAGTQGIREVKLFNLKDKVYSDFEDSLNEYVRSEIELGRNKAGIRNFYKMSAAITLFSLIYGGFTYTDLSLGSLGIFLLAMFQLAPKVSELNSEIYDLEGYLSHYVRTQRFLEDLEERQESLNGEEIESIEQLDIQNLSFRYSEDSETVIDELSLKIQKGDFVAFVGQSGAGKSTLISLISRMYEPTDGCIKSGGRDIRLYDLDSWRDRIAVVRQKAFIFNTSLEENIKVADPKATREEVEEVCRIAKVDEFVDNLPNGYSSLLGDDGIKLSGGQRQRVSLARALLKDADILVLDEATSDLDSGLEKKVQKNIESMDTDYGIIAIAHRLSTVKNADKIYTMDQGRIIEEGVHEDLLSKGGKYAELYNIQSKTK